MPTRASIPLTAPPHLPPVPLPLPLPLPPLEPPPRLRGGPLRRTRRVERLPARRRLELAPELLGARKGADPERRAALSPRARSLVEVFVTIVATMAFGLGWAALESRRLESGQLEIEAADYPRVVASPAVGEAAGRGMPPVTLHEAGEVREGRWAAGVTDSDANTEPGRRSKR